MLNMNDFTTEQHKLLVALPYRVGLWVSSSDSSGGDDADEAEKQALKAIVTGFAQDFLKSEFVQRLMEETIAHTPEWSGWETGLENVPDECAQAVEILAEKLDRKELMSFKLTMVEIATSVAMAYCEIEERDGMAASMRIKAMMLLDRLRAMITGGDVRSEEEILNISSAERQALKTLALALDLGPGSAPGLA